MGSGRPQKGMNSRNHHDSLSQSGSQRYTSGSSTPPRTTYMGAPTPKSGTPKASGSPLSRMGSSSSSGSSAPFKSM